MPRVGYNVVPSLPYERLEWLRNINLNRGYPYESGRTTNCINCAIITDKAMRANQRGEYSTTWYANPRPVGDKAELENLYGTRFESLPFAEIVRRVCASPEGTLGIVRGERPDGSGHVLNVIHENGVARFLDGQCGSELGGPDLEATYVRFELLWTRPTSD